MADWVHCNTCFLVPGGGWKFSLTSCGHIYCADCLDPGNCKMCGQKCTTIALSKNMKPDVEMFFLDPAVIAKRHNKQLVQVIEFQRNHRTRLTVHNRDKSSKQSNMMKSANKVFEQNKDLEREVLKLREENIYLRKLIGSMKGQAGSNIRNLMNNQTSPRSKGLLPSPSADLSPYGKNRSTPKSQGSHDARDMSAHTQTGPSRISIRTPPSNGRMGIISPSSVSPSQKQGNMNGSGETPMQVSPAGHHRSFQGSQSMIGHYPNTPNSMFGTPTPAQSPSPTMSNQMRRPSPLKTGSGDHGHRQIQLKNPPRSSIGTICSSRPPLVTLPPNFART